jgi:hypothetical protein
LIGVLKGALDFGSPSQQRYDGETKIEDCDRHGHGDKIFHGGGASGFILGVL